MQKLSPVRLLLILGVGVLFLLLLLLALLLSDALLNFYVNLQEAPGWLVGVLLGGLGLLSLLLGWLMMRLLRPKPKPVVEAEKPAPVVTREQVEERLESAREAELDTHEAEAELEALQERREAGEVHVALFGEISSGKSSLIKALLPEARVEVAVTGGTTQALQEYTWTSPAGDRLVLTDMPGLDEVGKQKDGWVRDEALRTHLVIYVCDGDLTRSQAEELEQLLGLRKPLILALNKSDRYRTDELQLLKERLRQQVERLGEAEVVAISAGGRRSVVRVLPDGSEEQVIRELPPQVDELTLAIQRRLDGDPATLEQLRDSAVFVLVSRRLDEALARHRQVQADKLVSAYAKKALVGAVAAMTPGTDILIQGYLAHKMVVSLSQLYEVPVRKVDVELLLELVQKYVKGHSTLVLAIAGNALKAFPGVGTLTGGVLHAIAYGNLFDALGRGVATSLASRGELHPLQVADQFKESLGEDLKASSRHYAKMALEELRHAARSD
ncbi:MAG: Era-like GTP-binding protein [Gammaproteobacteria bacterium]|nr:Era-like GTP-binding protein [Gammaproteobacteria bacterium]